MEITAERVLIDKGREILEALLPEVENTPGYLGWRIVETADFLPRKNCEIEIRALFLLVKVDEDANCSDVACHIESIEEKAYKDFANLVVQESLEGRVNIFVLIDFEGN